VAVCVRLFTELLNYARIIETETSRKKDVLLRTKFKPTSG
jgi:hypothetical protein